MPGIGVVHRGRCLSFGAIEPRRVIGVRISLIAHWVSYINLDGWRSARQPFPGKNDRVG